MTDQFLKSEDNWVEHINMKLLQLERQWQKMGIDEENGLQHRQKSVCDEICQYIDDTIAGENDVFDEILKTIKSCESESYVLAKEMGVEQEALPDGLGPAKLQSFLKRQLNRLRAEKSHRMEEVLSLHADDVKASDLIGESPYGISTTKIPTSDDLEKLRHHILEMKRLKESRFAMFVETKLSIITLFDELEMSAHSSFERQVVFEVEEDFALTRHSLKQLSELFDSLIQKQKANEEVAIRMRADIFSLMDKLKLESSADEARLIQLELSGHTPYVLRRLSQKLDELNVIKADRMGDVIESTRRELQELWSLCCYAEEDKLASFPLFASPEATDEVLEAHETEVERLRQYYSDNRHIFEMISRRQQLWHRMLELQDLQKDPTHLLKAKGTSLLQEEKDRKRINRQLPKLETELRERLAEYAERNDGRPFLIGGVPYEEYINRQIDQYETQVSQERENKAKARSKKTELEAKFGTTINNCTSAMSANFTPKTGLTSTMTSSAAAGLSGKRKRGQNGPNSTTSNGCTPLRSSSRLNSTRQFRYVTGHGSAMTSAKSYASTLPRATPKRHQQQQHQRQPENRGGPVTGRATPLNAKAADRRPLSQFSAASHVQNGNNVSSLGGCNFNKDLQSINWKDFPNPSLTSTLIHTQDDKGATPNNENIVIHFTGATPEVLVSAAADDPEEHSHSDSTTSGTEHLPPKRQKGAPLSHSRPVSSATAAAALESQSRRRLLRTLKSPLDGGSLHTTATSLSRRARPLSRSRLGVSGTPSAMSSGDISGSVRMLRSGSTRAGTTPVRLPSFSTRLAVAASTVGRVTGTSSAKKKQQIQMPLII